MHDVIIDPMNSARLVVNVLVIADEYERDDKLYDIVIKDVVKEDQFIRDVEKKISENILNGKTVPEIREFLRNEMRISESYTDELMEIIVEVESL